MKPHQGIQSKSFGFGVRAGEAKRRIGFKKLWAIDGGRDESLPIPDVLHLEPRISSNSEAVHELLELAFHGKEAAKGLDRKLGAFEGPQAGFNLELFARDLFVRELIRSCFTIEIGGIRFPVNQAYLYRVLSDPPTRADEVRFRQDVLRELEADGELHEALKELYQDLSQLLSMFKAPDHAVKLDINEFRLDLLKQARRVVDRMVESFSGARSGLKRLSEVGAEIQESPEFGLLVDLLEYESRLSTLTVRLGVGGDGEVKHLEILEIAENRQNRFYRSPLGRLWMQLRIFFYGYRLSPKEIVNRLLQEVFGQVSPALTPLVQLVGQLEFYLAGLSFRHQAAERGFATCLARFDERQPLELVDVFNPLLLAREEPVPCTIRNHRQPAITIVTGPNSGGKTRLLQTVGLSQLLGQSGLYVPASSARLPLIRGLFVSLVETETADQAEGRLGRELMRIRNLFEAVGSPSMVILDELCSGTNPAEGIEIFQLVLRLLDRLDTSAIISTHFLDFAKGLEQDPPVPSLEFLQVESRDDLTSTYQFVAGVAETSLAAATAERLGVTFEELSALIDSRREDESAA